MKKKEPIIKTCEYCNKNYSVHPCCCAKTRKYCSSDCYNKNNKKENNCNWTGGNIRHCTYCNKEIKTYSKQDKIRCMDCYNLSRASNSGSKNYRLRRTKKYRKWRKYIFDRDDYTCVLCNEHGGKLNVHHIVKISDIINSNPELILDKKNGITLCEKCHKKYVNGYEEEYEDYFNLLILDREILNNKYSN